MALFAASYALAGAALGVALPKDGWRWGVWLASPLWLLTLLSLSFAGGVQVFLQKDVPALIAAALAATAGAQAGARLSRRKAPHGRMSS